MAKQNRVRQEHDFLIHGELRGQRTFVVPRGTRDYRLIPELYRALQEGRALLNFHDPQGHCFLRILHLDYVGRWEYDEANHKVYYYRPIGVGFFTNGLHSGATGILKGEGKVPATEVDLTPLYAAGFGIEWQDGVALAVFKDKVVPMDHPHHALLLALGEVLHRHGLSL
jgi:hypothetical protein